MAVPGAPVFEEETRELIRDLIARASPAPSSSPPTTVRADYEALKARGVEFTEAPEERPYGIDCGFRDPSGNSFRLTQVKDLASL